MRIKWKNVIVVLLTVILIVLLPRLWPMLETLGRSLARPFHSTSYPGTDILPLGIICITILGIFITLTNRR